MIDKVFLRRDLKGKLLEEHYPIGYLMRRAPVKGEIGIEIECEGNKFKKSESILADYWKYTKDGSLRGQDNAEYVLAKPIDFAKVDEAIDKLWDMFKAYGTILDESNRTSVHVHLNVQKFHLNRLAAFLGMYFSLEELLTQWCGEHRVGNLFCLRGKDAPSIITTLKRFIQQDCGYELGNNLHYAGLNGNAISKFGSIEIRSLRGCTDPSVIKDWVAILRRMYEFSAEFKDPRGLVDSFSGGGPLAYFDMVLGDRASSLKEALGYDNQKIMESLYDGIRLAQDICYCREWAEYNPVTLREDPFGRVNRKSAQPDLSPADQATWSAWYSAHVQPNQTVQDYAIAPLSPSANPATEILLPADTDDNEDDEPESDDGWDYDEPDYDEEF